MTDVNQMINDSYEKKERKKKLHELLDKYGDDVQALENDYGADGINYMFAKVYLDEVLAERKAQKERSSVQVQQGRNEFEEYDDYGADRFREDVKRRKQDSVENTAKSPDTPLSLAKKARVYNGGDKYDYILDSVFKEEGGFEDDSKKIDQPTNMGITQMTLNNFNKIHPEFKIDKSLKDLNKNDVNLIYNLDYYNNYHLDKIDDYDNAKLLMHMFVMSNPNPVLKTLHSALNKFGYKCKKLLTKEMIPMLNHIEKDGKSDEFNDLLKSEYEDYLKSLKDAKKYRGWFSRLERL